MVRKRFMVQRPSVEERLVAVCDELRREIKNQQRLVRFADDVAEQTIDSLNSLLFHPPVEMSRRALQIKRRFIAGQAHTAELTRTSELLLSLERESPASLPDGHQLLEQCVGIFYASNKVFFTHRDALSARERWLLQWDLATLLLERAERAVPLMPLDIQPSFRSALVDFVVSGIACVRSILTTDAMVAAEHCATAFVEHFRLRTRLKVLAEQLTMSFCPLRRGDNNIPPETRVHWADGQQGVKWLEAWLRREGKDSNTDGPPRKHRAVVITVGQPTRPGTA